MKPNEIILAVVAFLSLTAVLSFFSFREKKSFWKGTLIKKDYQEADDEGGSDSYLLVFKTDKGKNVSVRVNQNIYDNYKIGDQAEKKSGEYLPVKLN
jgi:hypothetical protein